MSKYTYKEEKVFSFWFSILFWHLIEWAVHVDQTKTFVDKRPLRKTTFDCFKKEFEKIEWKIKDTSPNSLFTEYYYDSMFHAGVIKINYEGYILTAWGYYKAVRMKNRKIVELKNIKPIPRYEYRVCE